MKTSLIIFILSWSVFSIAQQTPDSLKINNSNLLSADSIKNLKDTVDSRPRNAYGDLLNDDPKYNRRYSMGLVLARVTSSNAFGWAYSRYVMKEEWAEISINTWKNSFKNGWEWDIDRFGTNFLIHPRAGSDYFNVARSNGYSFWASYPFTLFGSAQWEWLGENTKPSKNDLINTTISGAFLGEVLYRISSNILDDRRRGGEQGMARGFCRCCGSNKSIESFNAGKDDKGNTL